MTEIEKKAQHLETAMTDEAKALVKMLRAGDLCGLTLAADRIEALEAENKRLREWALEAYTIVEWCCGEGFLIPEPHFDCDEALLTGVALLGVKTSEQARAALEPKP